MTRLYAQSRSDWADSIRWDALTRGLWMLKRSASEQVVAEFLASQEQRAKRIEDSKP